MEIIPAIIPENFDDLRRKVSLVRGLVDVVHIDVSDGKFSPALNWPLSGDKEGDFGKFVKGDVSFPFWEELGFEVHLMLEGPEEQIDSWVSAGARRVIAHVESTSNLERLIKDFRQKSPKSSKLSSNPEFGMALLLDTPIELIYQHVEAADFVQLMSIAEIGYQGGEFRYEVLDKIIDLRGRFPDLIISVDGGVSLDNALRLKEAGASRLVVGSSLFGSADIRSTLKEFVNL